MEELPSYTTYRNSHKAPCKGASYDQYYATDPKAKLLWSIEQHLLSRFVKDHFAGREIHLLDFACGTGRVTQVLENVVTTSLGVDVSTSMLNQAKAKLKRTRLIQADLTRDNVLDGHKFNLITAFRFFLNAEPPLRLEVMRVLKGLLAEDGWLLFNNHRHRANPGVLLAFTLNQTLRRQPLPFNVMSRQEMINLVSCAGLRIAKMLHAGIVTYPLNKVVPRSVAQYVEHFAARLRVFEFISQDLIAACTHRACAGRITEADS